MLAAAVLAIPAWAGEYDDCTILSKSPSGIAFSYRSGTLSWVNTPQGEYPHLPQTALNSTPGLMPIPGRVIYVALPPGSRTAGVDLLATGEVWRFTRASMSTGSRPATAASASPYPGSRVMVHGIFDLHGVRILRLILHPLVVESPSGDMSLAASLDVRVRFDLDAPNRPWSPTTDARDPFESILSHMLLNAADGLSWREAQPPMLGAADASEPNPFAGTGRWLAIRTQGDGVIRLTPNDLQSAGVDLNMADPRAFRLFTGPGRMLSTRMSDPPPSFAEVAIQVTGAEDGRFNGADELLFWAQGVNRWEVGPDRQLSDVVNRYERDNVYWLATDGDFPAPPRRILPLPATPVDGGLTLFAAAERVRHEGDVLFRIGPFGVQNYYTWYWRNLRQSGLSFSAERNPESGASARIEVASYAGYDGRDAARLSVGGGSFTPVAVRAGEGEDHTTISLFDLPAFDPSAGTLLWFDSTASDNYYLDYYSVEYRHRLDLSYGPQKFAAPDTDAVATFVIANASGADIWDITDPVTPRIITGADVSGSIARFSVSLSRAQRRAFSAQLPSQHRSPQQVQSVTPPDLYTFPGPVDYLVIGPRAFESAMDEFMAYRAATDGLNMRFIAVEDVYNSFSYGLLDPVAIRRFLRYAHYNWSRPAPVYALLVGDGSYDFLDRTGAHSVNYVPPYITADDNTAVSDESYIYFSDRAVLDAEGGHFDNPFPDMLIGRWPVRDAAEIQAATSKIKKYESNEDLGDWRSRVMMVADDEFGDRRSGNVCEDLHIRNAERIAQADIPHRLDLEKIYLTEYPFDNPACSDPQVLGCTKSAAKEAIVAGLNEGVVLFDFIGHGNMDLLTHEHVFERATDLPRLKNTTAATAVLTFSCSIGFFDHPSSEGMAEEWFRIPQGGAVAVVSATRQTEALANPDLNEAVFDLLLNQNVTRIAAALYTGKLMREYFEPRCRFFTDCQQPPCPCDNDRSYVLFGDPAMRLGIPTLRARFTTVTPDSLTALALTRVEGEVVDTLGTLQSNFDGALSVTVRDVPRRRVYPVCTSTLTYDLAGGTLYRGRADVKGGRFAFGFIVPKDIAYGQRGATILGHAASTDRTADGVADSLWLGSSAGAVTDTTGPQIRMMTVAGESIVDGFRIAENAEVDVLLQDPSGINLTGAPGHRLLVTVTGSDRPPVDLTGAFAYDPGAFDRGRARFSLSGLGRGSRRLEVKGWDNANNSSVLTVDLDIVDPAAAEVFQLTEFLNYPNPFADATTFYFRATRAVSDARIRIFTLAGRLVREVTGAHDGSTGWDGRDAAGDPVSNGVYVAQIEATGEVISSGGQKADKTAYREIKLVVSR